MSQTNATQVNSILTSLNEGVVAAQPDLGFGYDGERPLAGVHDNWLIGFDIDSATFEKADSTKIPSIRVTCQWRLMNDPNHATPLEWKGESMNLPQGGSRGLPAGDRNGDEAAKKTSLKRFFAEKDEARLNGILTTVLNKPVTNLVTAIAEVQEILRSGTLVGVQVKCEYNPGKGANAGKFYFREYAQRNLASASTASVPA